MLIVQEEYGEKETVDGRKAAHAWHLKTRATSCFCSSGRIEEHDECPISEMYPTLVPKFENGQVF